MKSKTCRSLLALAVLFAVSALGAEAGPSSAGKVTVRDVKSNKATLSWSSKKRCRSFTMKARSSRGTKLKTIPNSTKRNGRFTYTLKRLHPDVSYLVTITGNYMQGREQRKELFSGNFRTKSISDTVSSQPGEQPAGTQVAGTPNGVTALEVKSNSARLKWTINRKCHSFKLKVWSGSRFVLNNKTVSNPGKSASRTYLLKGLDPDTKYQVRVLGKYRKDMKARTTLVRGSFTTPKGTETASGQSGEQSTPSSKEDAVHMHLITQTTARVRWTPPSDYEQFRVRWYEKENKPDKHRGTSDWLPPDRRVYILRRLHKNTEYGITIEGKSDGKTTRFGRTTFKTKSSSG